MSAEIDARVAEWRRALSRSATVTDADADELESHLRDQIEELSRRGLDEEEAFLVAVRRLGATDAITAEFAREHGDRLWKQLVPPTATTLRGHPLLEMILFTLGAAALTQVGRLIAEQTVPADWFARNVAFFLLPVLAAYLVRVRRMTLRAAGILVAITAVFAIVVNLYPFPVSQDSEIVMLGSAATSQTSALVAGHLFVVLWFVVLAAYLGGERWSPSRGMDAVRFTGEWFIYYVLIALGGGVLLGLTIAILSPIAPDAIPQVISWVLPSGAAGATVVAAWLVESKKSIIENLAPVLTAIFTPLFAAGLVVAVVVYAAAGIGRPFDRDLLVVFDVLLLVVVGLVLYGLSARDPQRPTGVMDVIRLVAVIAAVALDLLVLGSLVSRIGEYGLTPNRVVALGLNVLLVANLAVTAVLGFRRPGHVAAGSMARWQVGFVPVFGLWAAFVVLVLPPLFGFA